MLDRVVAGCLFAIVEAYLTRWSLELIPAAASRQKVGYTYSSNLVACANSSR